jgi:TrmH family RNA methyltransferase
LLVVAGVADPGNLGALARSAEAAGVRALILLSGGTSPWNAKALRGSMGSLLRLPVVIAEDALQVGRELGDRGIRQAVAATRGGEAPASFDWKGPIALWVGSETGTLPDSGRGLEPLTIPMSGEVESLNVTVAASLLLFAAGREGSKAP